MQMDHQFISNIGCKQNKLFIYWSLTLNLVLIILMATLKSCIKLPDITPDTEELTIMGYISDYLTHEKIPDVEVQVLGWSKSLFYGDVFYSYPIDTGYTDGNGFFNITFEGRSKNGYDLFKSKDKYFSDGGGVRSDINAINNLNWVLFPHGYIKSHIINKINTARWIEINFVTYIRPGQDIFREGFENTSIFSKAFSDSSFVTTTIGGLTNELKIKMTPTDNTIDYIQVKDTSFLTLRHDTLFLEIVLEGL